jgi:hypothetical protein
MPDLTDDGATWLSDDSMPELQTVSESEDDEGGVRLSDCGMLGLQTASESEDENGDTWLDEIRCI